MRQGVFCLAATLSTNCQQNLWSIKGTVKAFNGAAKAFIWGLNFQVTRGWREQKNYFIPLSLLFLSLVEHWDCLLGFHLWWFGISLTFFCMFGWNLNQMCKKKKKGLFSEHLNFIVQHLYTYFNCIDVLFWFVHLEIYYHSNIQESNYIWTNICSTKVSIGIIQLRSYSSFFFFQ